MAMAWHANVPDDLHMAYLDVLQLAERRSVDQVRAMMPAAESLPEALARVQGQAAKDTQAGGDDDDVAVESTGFSLRCPMSSQRMQIPAR